ncbi:hypothetical protein MMPV_003152 [Pyropia vietnamensis]
MGRPAAGRRAAPSLCRGLLLGLAAALAAASAGIDSRGGSIGSSGSGSSGGNDGTGGGGGGAGVVGLPLEPPAVLSPGAPLQPAAVAAANGAVGGPPPSGATEAYVTLLYGDAYVLPVRVMFASLVAHSPDAADGTRDRVVLVTPDVSAAARASLAADGIRTVHASVVRTPYEGNAKYDPRFDAVLTKLRVWTLVQYRRVLLLDGDVLISGDMAPLFGCGTFCAAFLNPCHFNSGVVLLTPSVDTYNRMQAALPRMGSYDGGDQGFLNSFYPDLLNAPSFREAPDGSPGGGGEESSAAVAAAAATVTAASTTATTTTAATTTADTTTATTAATTTTTTTTRLSPDGNGTPASAAVTPTAAAPGPPPPPTLLSPATAGAKALSPSSASTAPLDVPRRLPMGWHADHGEYYVGGFAWRISRARCGEVRATEFLGPPQFKPWLWWTYAALPLSWRWHAVRSTLRSPTPPGGVTPVGAAGRVVAWAAAAAVAIAAARRSVGRLTAGAGSIGGGGGLPLGGGRVLVWVPPRAFLLVSTGLAAAEWAAASVAAAVAVPPALPPVPAAALLVAAKFALAAAALAVHGHWFCASRLCVHPRRGEEGGGGGGGGGGISVLASDGCSVSVGEVGGVHGVVAAAGGVAATSHCRGAAANGASSPLPLPPPLLSPSPTPAPPSPFATATRRRIIRALLTAAAVDAVTPVVGAAALFLPHWGSIWAKMAAAAAATTAYITVVLCLHGRVALLWVRAAEAAATTTSTTEGGGGGGG